MKTLLGGLLCLLVAAGWVSAVGAAQVGRGILIVSPHGPYRDLAAALADAEDGDTVEVHAGSYSGPLVVDKSVTLIGRDWPVIDGGGQGTVVTLSAPGIRFEGFEVRGSGIEPDRDHAGITLTAPNIHVQGNRLVDVLFGIFVAQADGSLLRGNDITSKTEYEVGRKGDGIRLWYSRDVRVEDNTVNAARDVVMWYADNVLVKSNRIENGRYGVHLMYCNNAQIVENYLKDNSVGIYTMYSNDVTLLRNDVRGQRGPSGYALGFKDADNIDSRQNLLVDNRAGIFLDGTPYTPAGFARFSENIIAYNDIGVILLNAVQGAEFQDNTFWENMEQVSIGGGGTPGINAWRGNFWSDYTGFDIDGDFIGETAYHAERVFENLTDREPLLRALIYSPAAQAIEFAASSFPIFKPQPKLVDEQPSILPAVVPVQALPPRTQTQAAGMALAGFGLLAVGAASAGLTYFHKGNPMWKSKPAAVKTTASPSSISSSPPAGPTPAKPIVSAAHVTMRYGKVAAIDSVSFGAHAGEAIALWGANGAGKTTLLRAILGLIHYQGEIHVAGHDALRDGKAARRNIGYVPQEAAYYDMSLRATMAFYARLKQVNPQRIDMLLAKLGLQEHESKPVQALSGGLKQRLALAVALLSDPPILLLDEPTANLDASARREYLGFLAELHKEKKTIVFASHRLEEVELLADRVLIMDRGKVVEQVLVAELRSRLSPHIELTLWVVEAHRQRLLEILKGQGYPAHLNGRGTVAVRLPAGQKMNTLNLLNAQGIEIADFELEVAQTWN
jgi:nitrous oxidase accessory protein